MGKADIDVLQKVMSTLTIAYITNRVDCRPEWFFDSLHAQCGGDYSDIRIVVVDFYAQEHEAWKKKNVAARVKEFKSKCKAKDLFHVPPKPNVWQGPYRLPKVDFFAASNVRNTAICLAPDGYIAYVDDISVLLPGWLDRVRAAQSGGYVAFGTYAKVQKLVVQDGVVVSCVETVHGEDSRVSVVRRQFAHLTSNQMPTLIPAGGSWLFGCSLAAPVDAFLSINGWDEDCDSMGAEDYPCGHMIEQAGFKLFFDIKMKTLESEELHFVEKPFLRIDKQGVQKHKDASNAYLAMLLGGRRYAPNYFGVDGIAGLRKKVLSGEPFPICQIPANDWRDGQLLVEMPTP